MREKGKGCPAEAGRYKCWVGGGEFREAGVSRL
jgi:hypothetical protein